MGDRKHIRPVKNVEDGGGGHWLVRMEWCPAGWSVSLPLSVNLPLHHKVQKFSSGTGSPGWSRKKSRKTVMVWYYLSPPVDKISALMTVSRIREIY